MGNTEKDNTEKDSIEKDNLEKAKVEMTGQFSADVKLKECKYCRMLIPKSAKVCPNCKMQLKSRWLLYLLILLVLAALCAAGFYYRSYLWNLVESAEAVQSTDVLGPVEKADTVVEMSAADIGEEIQSAANDGQNSGAAIETQDADTKQNAAADTEDIEVSAVMDSFEVVRSEEKEDILSDAGLTGVDSDKSKEASEVSDDPDKTSAEDDADVKAADRRKDAKTSETEMAEETDETGETDETEEDTAEIMEIDIQDYTEEEFRDICEQIDYKSLLRKQDIYLNAAVKEELTVMAQVDGGLFDDNVYYLCMADDRKGITRYYIVRDDREEDDMPILEGDVLIIYGQLFNSCKLPSDMVSTQPVAPALTMVYYELLDE